jgi:hypothetical protein
VATHPAPKQFCQFASIEIELISAFFKIIQGKNLSPCWRRFGMRGSIWQWSAPAP